MIRTAKSLQRTAALIAFAIGSILRRRGKNIAVSVALTIVTAAFASALFLTDALRSEARDSMAEMPDITVSKLHGGRPALITRTDLDRLARAHIPGIASMRPRVWGYLFVEEVQSNLAIVGIAEEHIHDLTTTVMQGRPPRRGERNWAVLGEGLLRTLGVRTGDVLTLAAPGRPPTDFTIIGSFHRDAAVTTADVALLDERDARTLLGLEENEATDLAITLSNPDESTVVVRKISRELPDARVVERRALARAYELTYGTRGGLVALALLPCLLAMFVLAWDRATGLSAEERREIGVLKAVGWSTREVIAARMTEAVIVSAAAAALGTLGGYAYVFLFNAPGLLRALLGWSTLYPAFQLTPATDGSSLLAILAFAMGPYLAAAAVPAWRAATIDPAEAMRG